MSNSVNKDQQEQLVKKSEKNKKEISLDDLDQVSGGNNNANEGNDWEYNIGG